MRIAGLAAALFLFATPLGAADDPCAVPEYITKVEGALPQTAKAIKGGNLNVLIFGTRSSTLPGTEGAKNAYPARFEAALKAKLPKANVSVTLEIALAKLTTDMAAQLKELVALRKPTLVLWQTGIFDAMKNVDQDQFRAALDEGIAAVKAAGGDVILINQQYSPRTESMINIPAYAEVMRSAAREADVPLFDRLSAMKYWSEQGTFDFTAHGADKGKLAERVHECFGKLLVDLIVDTAKPTKTGFSRQ